MGNLAEPNNQFEKSWQVAFQGTEMAPAPEIWTRLDAHLANAESKRSKRIILFYQMVAAASLALAIGVGIFAYLNLDGGRSKSLTQSEKPAEISTGFESEKLSGGSQIEESNPGALPTETTAPIPKGPGTPGAKLDGVPPVFAEDNQPQKEIPSMDQSIPLLVGNEESGLAQEQRTVRETSESSLGMDLIDPKKLDNYLKPGFEDYVIYRVPGNVRSSKNKFKINFWAGLDVGSGVFDPNFEQGSQNVNSASQAAFDQSSGSGTVEELASLGASQSGIIDLENDPGLAVTVGANWGVVLAPRWSIQSGLQYGNFSSSSHSNAFAQGLNNELIPLSLANLEDKSISEAQVTLTDEFELETTYEFISIPLKAGYQVLDRKVGILVNGGVTTDIFLRNKISSDQFGQSSISASDESPFRKVYWSGITGLTFSYTLNKNYWFTLEPSYRISLNSFTTSGSAFESRPNLFSISLGVRYNFK